MGQKRWEDSKPWLEFNRLKPVRIDMDLPESSDEEESIPFIQALKEEKEGSLSQWESL